MNDRRSRDVSVVLGGEMSEDRWWSNVEFWRGVCEVAVLYGYHPTFAHDINVVATSFPRGLCWTFIKKVSNQQLILLIISVDLQSICWRQHSKIINGGASIRLQSGQNSNPKAESEVEGFDCWCRVCG